MVHLGYALSSEEHPANDLVGFARRAEEVGFDQLTVRVDREAGRVTALDLTTGRPPAVHRPDRPDAPAAPVGARLPPQPVAGPFTANLGGFLMACMYGLTGVRIKSGPPELWCDHPVRMPRSWDGVHVPRLYARGRPASLTAEHGADRACLEFNGP